MTRDDLFRYIEQMSPSSKIVDEVIAKQEVKKKKIYPKLNYSIFITLFKDKKCKSHKKISDVK